MAAESFIAVPRDLLAADLATGVDLFLRVGDRYVLYRRGDESVDAASLDKLQRRQVEVLYVDGDDTARLDHYVRSNLGSLLERAPSPAREAQVLRQATRAALGSALHRIHEDEAIQQVRAVSDATVERIAENVAILPGLVRFVTRDERLFTHSINVAAYSVALGSMRDDLRGDALGSIGLGALLHDVGLVRAKDALLDAPMTDLERTYLARHPARGAAMLQHVDDPVVLDIVANHHGLPDEGELSLPAQIVQVADVFDTLTTSSATPEREGPFAALYHMRYRMDGRHSPDLIREFVMLLGGMTVGDLDSPVAPLSRRRFALQRAS